MPNASIQGTSLKAHDSVSTASGTAQKKKRNRRRIRNKNKAATNNTTATSTDNKEPQAKLENLLSKTFNESIQNAEALNISLQKTILPTKTTSVPSAATENMKQTTAATPQANKGVSEAPAAGKTREQILTEREAKKSLKQAKKQKPGLDDAVVANLTTSNAKSKTNTIAPTLADKPIPTQTVPAQAEVGKVNHATTPVTEKSREQIKAEREAKKQAKQVMKTAKQSIAPAGDAQLTQQMANVKITANLSETSEIAIESKKKPTLSKAERRAIQEAQRAAKTVTFAQKVKPSAAPNSTLLSVKKPNAISRALQQPSIATVPVKSAIAPSIKTTKKHICRVKLFNHLETANADVSLFVNNPEIHPIIARLGEQYAKRTIVGSNARCIAFLNALIIVIKEFETPPKKEFGRSLEAFIKNCVDHLHKCRPLAVSVSNVYKHIKHVLTQLPTDKPETELKLNLCHFIESYIENQIGKAALAISASMQDKIADGDVILTFGCSSLINYIFEEAHRRHVKFRTIVVDSRPFSEGQELLRRLCAKEIPCTYVLINAVSFVMPEVTKVLLGAHALLSNGYVMARTGTAQVALVARSFNVPVLVCCETHKFSERFQTDAIVYNEIGNPDDLIFNEKCCLTNWQAKGKMSPLNLNYDITPPELVTAVVTEVSILPCTSVPVILRIKPAEIGYYN